VVILRSQLPCAHPRLYFSSLGLLCNHPSYGSNAPTWGVIGTIVAVPRDARRLTASSDRTARTRRTLAVLHCDLGGTRVGDLPATPEDRMDDTAHQPFASHRHEAGEHVRTWSEHSKHVAPQIRVDASLNAHATTIADEHGISAYDAAYVAAARASNGQLVSCDRHTPPQWEPLDAQFIEIDGAWDGERPLTIAAGIGLAMVLTQ